MSMTDGKQEYVDKCNDVYRAAKEFEGFETQFLEVIDTYHECSPQQGPGWPVHMCHITARDTSKFGESMYTYPIINKGRDMGLEVFDVVADFQKRTMRIRFKLAGD